MAGVTLPSACSIEAAESRLLRFCREEFDYYDGVLDSEPNHIMPVDLLATVAVNSFVNSATAIRKVHRELARRCDPILCEVPQDAELLDFDPELHLVEALLHASIQAAGVLIPVATKVLHRKRRHPIPMLDNVVLGYYLNAVKCEHRWAATQDKRKAAAVAIEVLRLFRTDLRAESETISHLRAKLVNEGYPLSPVRILEVLVWSQAERQGHYR